MIEQVCLFLWFLLPLLGRSLFWIIFGLFLVVEKIEDRYMGRFGLELGLVTNLFCS